MRRERKVDGMRRCEGFTLIEVVVAITILSIAIGGICMLGVLAKEASDKARDHYIAVNIAKNRIEGVQVFDYEQLDRLEESATVVDESGNPSSGGHFRRTTTVSNVKTNLREVVVTVDILDRESVSFAGENEMIRSYVADIFEVAE